MTVDINNAMVVAMDARGDEKSQKTKNKVLKQRLFLHITSILNAQPTFNHFF